MRLLANENIPLSAVGALRACGHDVLWIREKSPGITDIEVMELGHREKTYSCHFRQRLWRISFFHEATASKWNNSFSHTYDLFSLHSESSCKSYRVA